MSVLKVCGGWVFVLVFSVSSFAAPEDDVFSALSSGGQAVSESKIEQKDYALYLSVPKKINSVWTFDRTEVVSAKVQSQTFEFSADHRFTDIRKRTQQALFSLSARQLYSCEGLDCGSSNVWANEVFKVKQLYGLDQNQDYSVWELMRANEIRYAVVYLTQRGNRRSYMQVEFVVPTRVSENGLAASPKSILSAIQSNGYYVVPGNISMPEGNPHIEAIVTALNRMPLLKFAVVGHAAVEASLDGNIATSLAIANGVSDALQAGGVSESRMLVKGVGSLVPEASSKPLRVVLVKL